MNVPKLRFKEFNDEYGKLKYKDVLKIKSGKDQKQVEDENGKYPILGTGGQIGKTNSFLYDKPSVLIGRKGTINKPQYMESPFWTVDTLFYSHIYEPNIPKYLFYSFQNVNWKKYDESTGVPSLSSSTIESVECSIPSPNEQIKVANFLSLLDKKIELQTKKIEDLKLFTKKLETQYIFNSNNEYNKKRIDEIFNVKAGGDLNKNNISFIKTPLFCYPIYSNNLEMNGLYGYSDIYKIGEESITVTGRGDIGKAIKREGKYYPIVRLLVLIPKISVNLIYMQEAINNLKLIQESTGVPQLTAPQISKYKVSYPTLDIQNEYGDILLLLQEKIKYEISKAEKLQQLKKGLMQSMFV